MAAPVLLSEFEPNNISFGRVQKNTNSPGKFCYINYGTARGALSLQTPVVRIPYGISTWDNDDGSKSLSVEVPLKEATTDAAQELILQKFNLLDDVVLSAAAKNAAEWGLRPNQSKDAYRALYKGATIKENKDGDKKFVGKINQRRDVFVFDNERNQVDKEYVTKGSLVKMIIEIGRVWISGGSFGVVCTLTRLLVVQRRQEMKPDAFIEDPSDKLPEDIDVKQDFGDDVDIGPVQDF
jgi:hypothetical protein